MSPSVGLPLFARYVRANSTTLCRQLSTPEARSQIRTRNISSTATLLSKSDDDASSSESKQKGVLSKMWDKYSPQGQQHRILIGERLFWSAERHASDPIWYNEGRIGRQFRPRHAMLTLHVWLLHKRLLADTNDPHSSLLIQEELFDILWNNARARIRAEGVNELTVNKHLKDVQQITFQQCTHLDHAFSNFDTTSFEKRSEEIAAAIWMHILLKDEEAYNDHIRRLTAYVEYQFANIVHHLPEEFFREGRIGWGNIPDFSNMIDNEGNPMDDATIFEDDWLPENWTRAITEAGETYYWDIKTSQSQWERPA
mmetsp:Transcript_12133/g.17690  ORF Transcript_12133/g.17690 Transcript_12133/m.17690 type:complete len:312 (-) Transcript_12133:295-1230(-)